MIDMTSTMSLCYLIVVLYICSGFMDLFIVLFVDIIRFYFNYSYVFTYVPMIQTPFS